MISAKKESAANKRKANAEDADMKTREVKYNKNQSRNVQLQIDLNASQEVLGELSFADEDEPTERVADQDTERIMIIRLRLNAALTHQIYISFCDSENKENVETQKKEAGGNDWKRTATTKNKHN